MTPRKRIKLSNGRRLVCDIVRLANKVPAYGLIKDVDVRPLTEVRKHIQPKLAWTTIMMKAYAQVGCRIPELRQHYVSFPWPQIYQHDRNVAMVVVSREYEGEERLLFARINSPEERSLLELHEEMEHYRNAPVNEIRQFRHQIRFARMPSLVRRVGWWLLMNVFARKTPSKLGTFGISVSTAKDIWGTRHLSPGTSTVGVDLVSRGGIGRTLLTFDHRIFDAIPAGKVFLELIKELHGPILTEMRQIAAAQKSSEASTTGQPASDAQPASQLDSAAD